ncbi:MAG: oligosaccharide flippase family protein [Neisseriaceae bacterium]|nr:oligosaccharide flippase family protein [Neisseriaceae bacterium]
MQKLINLSLRMISTAAKFVLIVLITKNIGQKALGEYGLFFSTITIAFYFMGMDFYVFNTRELIAHPEKEKRAILIRDQFIFYLFTYAIVLPSLLLVFFLDIIDFHYLLLFYLVLITEHLSQELYRLFITLSHQTWATLLLFIRSASWIYVLALLSILGFEQVHQLKIIYASWFLGGLLCIIISMIYLIKSHRVHNFYGKINFAWMKQGLMVSLPFFIGTIAYKVVEFSNRYIINFFMSKEDVGIFTFFSNIANSLQTIVFTLVIMMYYPKVIDAYQKNEHTDALIKNFTKETIVYSLAGMIAIGILIYPLLGFLNKAEFFEQLPIFWILLFSALFMNLSFVPHYQLFALKQDLLIRNITLMVAVLNVVLTCLLVFWMGLYGAAMAMLISCLAMYLLKQKHLSASK